MNRSEIMDLIEQHDKENFRWIRQEEEIGKKLREARKLTKDDLIKIMEWKFESDARIKTVQVKYAQRINEQHLEKVSGEVFDLDTRQDLKRINLLCGFKGIGPAVASVILTFYDPTNYCVVDFHVYQEVFGVRPSILTPEKYLRLLRRFREEARAHKLRVRDIEKAYFFKNCKATSCK